MTTPQFSMHENSITDSKRRDSQCRHAMIQQAEQPRLVNKVEYNPWFDNITAIENERMNVQLRNYILSIDQRLQIMQNQIASKEASMKSHINQDFQNISATSINNGVSYQAPVINMNHINTMHTSGNVPVNTQHTTSTTLTPLVPRLSRNVKTIPELWHEWFFGLNGSYSVVDHERLEPGWYKLDKSFFNRRKRIIKTIQTYAKENALPEETAVQIAEARRVRFKKTLDYLGKNQRFIFE